MTAISFDRSVRRFGILAVAAVLAACSGGDASEEPATSAAEVTDSATAEAEAEENVPAVRGYPTEATGGVAGVLGEEGTGEKVAVTLTEWGVQVSPTTLGGGPTTFVIENRGQRSHSVEVFSEHYGRWRSAPIPPGGSATMSMPLTFATYEVFCPMEDGAGNHKAKGMVATVRVQ